jgi:hypothetical protein
MKWSPQDWFNSKSRAISFPGTASPFTAETRRSAVIAEFRHPITENLRRKFKNEIDLRRVRRGSIAWQS